MSYPFLIWTVQRTGGTSLTELLMKMSEHQSADHEPFNWRRHKPRQFGHIAQHWAETKDNGALEASLGKVFVDRYLIKHCYELHGTPFSARMLRAAAKTDYRHILLLRRDELSRLVSKFIAEANGTWFKDHAAKVYAGIASQKRELEPLPVEAIVRHYENCSKMTDNLRDLLVRNKVNAREIYYEDIYVGDREARLKHLNGLFDFLGFTPETVEAHRADIEEKIFDGGQNTRDILQFVPNLADVRTALAEAGYGAAELPLPVARPKPAPVDDETDDSEAVEAVPGSEIFTAENGFVPLNQLGYNLKELNRVIARYRTFIQPNVRHIAGRRVLDLGSYDGRWAFAALENGAAEVVGIEQRQDFIDRSRYFIKEGMRDRVRFIQGDMFDALDELLRAGERFDVILCLGVFYEIMDHRRLLKQMAAFEPQIIVVDTNLIDSDEPVIRVKAGDGPRKTAPVGVVSRKGVELMTQDLNYAIRYEKWNPGIFDNQEGLADYFATNKAGIRRYTFYLERN